MPDVPEGQAPPPRETPRSGAASVVENRLVSPGHFLIRLRPAPGRRPPRPGQFYMVSPAGQDSTDPLLRRPLSLHRVFPDGSFSLLYRVVGRGTAMLSRKNEGEALDVLGPLGNGFPTPPNGAAPVLAGGGIGIVPLVALAGDLMLRAEQDSGAAPTVVLGARTAGDMICVDDFRGIGIEPELVTDDGSLGRKALVTELVDRVLGEGGGPPRFVYGCGPRPMLAALDGILGRRGVPGALSLEETMACGLGACLGCVTETRQGRRRVCLEGPVFAAGDVVWKRGAP